MACGVATRSIWHGEPPSPEAGVSKQFQNVSVSKALNWWGRQSWTFSFVNSFVNFQKELYRNEIYFTNTQIKAAVRFDKAFRALLIRSKFSGNDTRFLQQWHYLVYTYTFFSLIRYRCHCIWPDETGTKGLANLNATSICVFILLPLTAG